MREAFANADAIHKQYIDMGVEDVGEPEECRDDQPAADAATEGDDAQETTFDANALEDSMEALYKGARSSKLATTVLLMNLCTVHGSQISARMSCSASFTCIYYLREICCRSHTMLRSSSPQSWA